MAKIQKIIKDGKLLYPVTITNAIRDNVHNNKTQTQINTELYALLDKITFAYDSTEKKMNLKNGTTVIGSVDCSNFIKDGFLESVEWSGTPETSRTLVFTWNTDADKTVTPIDLSKFADSYDGSNLVLSVSYETSDDDDYDEMLETITGGDSLDVIVSKLVKVLQGVLGEIDDYAPIGHTHSSNQVTAMTGYAKLEDTSAIATTDSLNTAIGKLEKKLDNAISGNIDLNPATTEDLGGVIIGDNITVNNTGEISITTTNVETALGYRLSFEGYKEHYVDGGTMAYDVKEYDDLFINVDVIPPIIPPTDPVE